MADPLRDATQALLDALPTVWQGSDEGRALRAALAAADGTTPTQPDEVLWEGPLGEMSRAWQGCGNHPDDTPERRVRVVAPPATVNNQPTPRHTG